jgi:ribonuclease HI
VGSQGERLIKRTLVFDGGSRGNPGPAYGSFLVLDERGRRIGGRRLNFGRGTNNEAEYRTLIAGLRWLLDGPRGVPSPQRVDLEIRGDSRLVLSQLSGAWKAKNKRMRALRDEARQLLARFGHVRYVQQPRSESVRLLGH